MISQGEKISAMQKDIIYIRDKIDNLEKSLNKKYVTRMEFEPIKKVVYGLIAAILLSFLGGLLSFVL